MLTFYFVIKSYCDKKTSFKYEFMNKLKNDIKIEFIMNILITIHSNIGLKKFSHLTKLNLLNFLSEIWFLYIKIVIHMV